MRVRTTTLFASIIFLLSSTSAALGAGSPVSLTPAVLHSAYSLPRTASTRQTVAVVVAYGDPTIERDLHTFSTRFGLSPCTVASGCLRRVNQQGQSKPLPAPDPTGGKWTTEAALSTETLHGVCQNCRLLIVEASSEANTDLASAVDTAVRLGAREISTSYVFTEGLFDSGLAKHYDHPGVAITAASGDGGFSYGTNVPASYPGVVAVGGTNLRLGRKGSWAGESAWHSADGTTASGCSSFTAAPSWQSPFAAAVGCAGHRAVVDVAATAGPGAPVFSSTPLTPQGQSGWFDADGTSVSSPIVAGVFALAGGLRAHQTAGAVLYRHLRQTRNAFHDLTTGTNGSCGGKPICQARKGFDGVSGVGTPRGLAGFRAP